MFAGLLLVRVGLPLGRHQLSSCAVSAEFRAADMVYFDLTPAYHEHWPEKRDAWLRRWRVRGIAIVFEPDIQAGVGLEAGFTPNPKPVVAAHTYRNI